MWNPRRTRPRVDDELRFHRDRLIEDLMAKGLDRQAAERRAFLEFGNLGAIGESVRDVRGRRLDDFARDLRYALRTLRRHRGFAATAILTLALGVGVNAAVFSLFYRMIVRPLPVPEAGRLVNLVSPGPRSGPTSCGGIGRCEAVFSYPMFRDLERLQTVFTGLAAHRDVGVNLTSRGAAAQGQGLLVSGGYFPVLGLQPALGRLLGPDDDRVVGAADVVVLSHAFWQRHFAAATDVVGETLVVNGQALTIVGVSPAEFDGTTVGLKPDVFVPITMRWRLERDTGRAPPEERRAYWLYLFARLKPGVSLAQAQTAIDTPYRAIIRDVEVPLQQDLSGQMLAQFAARGIRLDPGSRGQSTFTIEARAPLTLLVAITALVLLVTCLNVANLLLARTAVRARELATRLSIGATRGRLVAQLLTESAVLAVLAAVASLLVARWTTDLFRGLLPEPDLLPGIDRSIPLLVTAALAVVTSLAIGLWPALRAVRSDVLPALRAPAGLAAGRPGRSRVQLALAVGQVAVSMALVVLAGLFTRSLANVIDVDPGLTADGVITFRLSPQRNGDDETRSAALFARIEEQLASLPGVTDVASSTTLLFSGDARATQAFVEGFDAGPDVDRDTRYDEIGSGYFRTLGIALVAGREFTASDAASSAPVAIVNEQFARKFGLGRDAVGKRLSRGSPVLDLEIVGLVRDFKQQNLRDAVAPMFFVPHRQGSRRPGVMIFYVRTSGDTAPIVAAVRRVVRALDPNLPIENLRTIDDTIRGMTTGQRVMSVMTGAFAFLALFVAAVGLYGMLAYAVAQRTPEIGVRVALGASRAAVRWMVLRQVGAIVALGGAVGLAVALGVGRIAQNLLFGLRFHDPAVLAASIGVLVAVALAAGALPARRAASIDPMRALKSE